MSSPAGPPPPASSSAAAASSAAASSPSAAAPAPSSSSSSSSPSLSPSFRPTFANLLGASLLDDNIRLLSDFLYQHAAHPDIEIEGKLGLVFNRKKETRIHLDGVKSLVYVATDELEGSSFAAEIDANMFRHLNESLIQRRYREDQAKARAHQAKPYWTYKHTHQTDKFYTVGSDRVRVSTDDQGRVLECIVKEKVQHLDFWNGKPKCIDFRISANRERKVDLPKTECDQIRRKDRMSYRFDLWALELTKVELFTHIKPNGEPATDKPHSTTFEVELEIREWEFVRREAAKVKAGMPNDFVKIATAFFDNLRTLAQYAFPGQAPPGWKVAAPVAAPPPTKKRPREEEQPKQEYGRVWS